MWKHGPRSWMQNLNNRSCSLKERTQEEVMHWRKQLHSIHKQIMQRGKKSVVSVHKLYTDEQLYQNKNITPLVLLNMYTHPPSPLPHSVSTLLCSLSSPLTDQLHTPTHTHTHAHLVHPLYLGRQQPITVFILNYYSSLHHHSALINTELSLQPLFVCLHSDYLLLMSE